MSEGSLLALGMGLKHFVFATPDLETTRVLSAHEVIFHTNQAAVLLCNRALVKGVLGRFMPKTVLDVLELFAFVHPAENVVPTTTEIAKFLEITPPVNAYEEAKTLFSITRILLSKLASLKREETRKAASLALTMTRQANWIWGRDILAALGKDPATMGITGLSGFAVWDELLEFKETVPLEPSGTQPVSEEEAEKKLQELLLNSEKKDSSFQTENRLNQVQYSKTAAKMFLPPLDEAEPISVLLEAGTGIGKTLGYLSATSVWTNKNAGSIWISTYTRNLQRQLHSELSSVFSSDKEKDKKVVIRKGRENYLCLLNFAEAVGRIPQNPLSALPLGLIARWISKTKQGDLTGGDFPDWLSDLMNKQGLLNLADKRGECLYAQCPHYKKCFIEKVIRRSRVAKIVIANHALVLTQLSGAKEEAFLPTRFIFDEAHQLFDACDNIFCGTINLKEGLEMRRCLLGSEEARHKGRAQGIQRRLEDLCLIIPDIASCIQDLNHTASFLPRQNALTRVKNRTPQGNFEVFLTQIYRQVLARADKADVLYSLECTPRPASEELVSTAKALKSDVIVLEQKVRKLIALIEKYLDEETANLETSDKQRYTAALRSLQKTIAEPLAVWRVMLEQLNFETPKDFIDWLEISRTQGFDSDVGYHRHWVDPTFPFAQLLKQTAHGVLMTSATLKDKTGDEKKDWRLAKHKTGVVHFFEKTKNENLNQNQTQEETKNPLFQASFPSPFDYEKNARVFIITDIDKRNIKDISAAYRELFIASEGGALGIFTAIKRLKEVHHNIKDALAQKGLPLFAQHIDTVNLQTLLEIFKSQEDACLLGTDATRDGIDVPGESLRMIVFDKVPWPRPDIAHQRRKQDFPEEKEAYNYMILRTKLSQAFGRLIRKKDDKGVFVLLDKGLPSETLSAFPQGVVIEKLGLKEALIKIKEFL